jgi:hypothetical protein
LTSCGFLAALQNPAGHAGFDFRLDPFVHDLAEFLSEVGDGVQAGQLERFQRGLRRGDQELERRLDRIHDKASLAFDPSEAR